MFTRSKHIKVDIYFREFCNKVSKSDKRSHKHDYMKNLANSNVNNKPTDWDDARSYNDIPGPKPLPIIGNVWRYFPIVGSYYGVEPKIQLKQLHEQFGDVVRLSGLKLRNDFVYLFNPTDFEKVYRTEGIWPIRHSFLSMVYYRSKLRRDAYQGNVGIVTSQREDWYRTRTAVNPIMLKPSSTNQYLKSLDDVAQDFVNKIDHLRRKNPNGEMPIDFDNEVNKWALESICLISLNKKLGSLSSNLMPGSEGQIFIDDVLEIFNDFYELDVKPSLWKWISTSKWRRFVKAMDRITLFVQRNLDEAIANFDKNPVKEMSILEQVYRADKNILLSIAFDMLIAGIDTTGRVASTALYYISANPKCQEKLRNELMKHIPTAETEITTEILQNLPYLRAVIKESMRLSPVVLSIWRRAGQDLTLSGYKVRKGTNVIMCNVICDSEDHFPKAQEFIPERWLRGANEELMYHNLNPFAYLPFGYGPRSCVGRRLANLELEVAISKVIRNFKLEWPHAPMKWSTALLHGIASPLQFRATKI